MIDEDVRNGLVFDMPVFGNANDYSGNGNHGVVTDATLTTDRYGRANRAYLFTKDTKNRIGANVPVSYFQNGFTISALINPISMGGSDFGRIMHLSNTSSIGEAGFTFGVYANRLAARIVGSLLVTSGINSIVTGQDNHIILTVTPEGLITFYINGAISGTPASSKATANITSTDPIIIGNMPANNYICSFDGKISDIRIYNRIPDLGEIKQLCKL